MDKLQQVAGFASRALEAVGGYRLIVLTTVGEMQRHGWAEAKTYDALAAAGADLKSLVFDAPDADALADFAAAVGTAAASTAHAEAVAVWKSHANVAFDYTARAANPDTLEPSQVVYDIPPAPPAPNAQRLRILLQELVRRTPAPPADLALRLAEERRAILAAENSPAEGDAAARPAAVTADDAEKLVARYVARVTADGRDPATLTRDGIVNGLKTKGTPVSAGLVSGTKTWNQVAASKGRAISPPPKGEHPQHVVTGSSPGVESNVTAAIESGDMDAAIEGEDWEAYAQMQAKEARANRVRPR